MANPLKELPLQNVSFQRIQETSIDAPPAKVWAALVKPNNWFGFDADRATWPKSTLDLKPGGSWVMEGKDGMASLMGTVTHIEPGKLLRFSGQMGMTHVPCLCVFIFELQPKNDGKGTLLRVGQRVSGYMDPEAEKRSEGGWQQLMGNLKKASEG